MLDGHRKCLHDCTFVRFIFDPRQTATQGKLVSYAMKFGLYSVAILVDSSLFTKPHVPQYYAFIKYQVRTEIFKGLFHIHIYIMSLKLPLITGWSKELL